MKEVLTIIFLLCNYASFSQAKIDCVFNNNYKGLTSEWLNELGMTDFVWNSDTKYAELHSNNDTIFVQIGGCVHFGIFIKLKLVNGPSAIRDTDFWLKKAYGLAEDFELKHYMETIQSGNLERIEKDNYVWLKIEDDNMDDNLFYCGIEIDVARSSKILTLGKYYN